MARTRRTLTAALLATLVLAPSLASARPATTPKAHAAVHATASPSDLLIRLWHSLRSLWGKEGVLIDPNGAHVNGATTRAGDPGAMSDAGMLIDPNG
jgi:photosystem II stability/assembly factor-like uncharacterized protein